MYFKVFGLNRKGQCVWLCNLVANSIEEAYAKAFRIYGTLFVNYIEEVE